MSKRKSKAITIGKSEKSCRICKGTLYVKKHPYITDKQRSQVYYFEQWDYCPNCNKVFFDEKYKVHGEGGAEYDEHLRQQAHFKGI